MAESEIRMPVFAGQFYPATALALRKQIESFIRPEAKKQDTIACLLPHAGYIYSGRVATETLSCIEIRDTVILLGPNHTGYGKEISIMTEGIWQTPLGKVEIDTSLAKKILQNSAGIEEDNLAHASEHSLEVELPLLQYFKSNFKIVPIAFMFEEVDTLKEIGRAIAETVKDEGLKNRVLILASSDMTHYEPQARAQKNDLQAIEAILSLDPDRLAGVVERFNISMCGLAPAIAMISAARALGASGGKLVKYQTSGDVTGETNSVVGYAGITIS